jgi:hypothetical protein
MQMEAERLARQQKRTLSSAAGSSDMESISSSRPRKRLSTEGAKETMMTFGEMQSREAADLEGKGPSASASGSSGPGRTSDGSAGNEGGNGSGKSSGRRSRTNNKADRFWDRELRMTNNCLTEKGPGEKTMTISDIIGPACTHSS